MTAIRVTVWNENRHEQRDPKVKAIYPEGMHGAIARHLRENGMTVAGQGAHSDIVMASALALVNALNRLQSRVQRQSAASEGP